MPAKFFITATGSLVVESSRGAFIPFPASMVLPSLAAYQEWWAQHDADTIRSMIKVSYHHIPESRLPLQEVTE